VNRPVWSVLWSCMVNVTSRPSSRMSPALAPANSASRSIYHSPITAMPLHWEVFSKEKAAPSSSGSMEPIKRPLNASLSLPADAQTPLDGPDAVPDAQFDDSWNGCLESFLLMSHRSLKVKCGAFVTARLERCSKAPHVGGVQREGWNFPSLQIAKYVRILAPTAGL